ncbi:L-rhamnose-binding lectin ELEL-1-like isoform X2 [Triplophysa rosa]|uniref:L-rhamnose-binding lectin ELEL-1-like isoform X2 n=1 Tax=Triplophysa rosa TaxID=992332 RepID=UPI002545C650|nr:L-rhamnose-binding lectin ELEL-1-like isoform X2 [Triplophysa rosa]
MLQQELTFITLLMLLCQHGLAEEPANCREISCETFEICQYEKRTISCPKHHKISVHYANYGRTDTSVCPHSNATLTPANCYSDQTRILQLLCNGRNGCNLYISSLVYLDQCPHIYKYLKVFYTCEAPGSGSSSSSSSDG